jgi:hypothetical protein
MEWNVYKYLKVSIYLRELPNMEGEEKKRRKKKL